MKKSFMLFFLVLNITDVFGCLILFITDGKQILVANHEDWYAADAEVTVVPPSAEKLGVLYFDFQSEGTAQGGMNEAGLFFDGTATPPSPYPKNKSKADCHCYIWKKILEECRNIEEAIHYIEKYRVPEIAQIHVLFADALGHSAIVGIYDGELQVTRNNGNHQLLTNFNITNPSYGGEPVCRRFQKATAMLGQDSSATVANVRKILSETHQDKLTVYSNIYNLSKREVYIYRKTDFNKVVKLNLPDELKKGKHSIALSDLFK